MATKRKKHFSNTRGPHPLIQINSFPAEMSKEFIPVAADVDLSHVSGVIRAKIKGAKRGKGRKKSKKQADLEKTASQLSSVIYLGHIPHGFFEDQMKGFFSQFGEVVNLRLCRSKKSGRSRGYAFVEFESADVGEFTASRSCYYFCPFAIHIVNCSVENARSVATHFGNNMPYAPSPRGG